MNRNNTERNQIDNKNNRSKQCEQSCNVVVAIVYRGQVRFFLSLLSCCLGSVVSGSSSPTCSLLSLGPLSGFLDPLVTSIPSVP